MFLLPFAALPRKDTIYKPFSLYLHREKYSFLHQMSRFGGETCSEPPFVHQMSRFGGETVGKMGLGIAGRAGNDRRRLLSVEKTGKLSEMMYICGKDHKDECICK